MERIRLRNSLPVRKAQEPLISRFEMPYEFLARMARGKTINSKGNPPGRWARIYAAEACLRFPHLRKEMKQILADLGRPW